jgi:biopolymer transport protein ExbB/TolQ/biopolymer transport protein ExbD
MDTLNEFIKSFSPTQSGWFFMWILLGIAFAALSIMIDRWICLNSKTNIDSDKFVDRLVELIKIKKFDDAIALCFSGKKLALPRILGAGISKALTVPELMKSAMEQESISVIPSLEKRLNLIVACGNIATLLGLMGTIYGLILAFAAVAQPDVSPVEKSSLLAVGISAAMNTTLLGLVIAVPCVLIYSIFRTRIDETIAEIDRFAVVMLKVALPDDAVQKSYKVSNRRIKEEVETEPNMVPFMNLMVVLIPLLLSSSEFVKIGMIELKLPESAQGGGTGGAGDDFKQNAKLDLGVVITANGFNILHYFRKEPPAQGVVDVPKKNGSYDYELLNKKLSEVKQLVLIDILRTLKADLSADIPLATLYSEYLKHDFSTLKLFEDHESIKIVAEDKIQYQVVISVMDAARGIQTSNGNVTMFPNVSIAGGIVQ